MKNYKSLDSITKVTNQTLIRGQQQSKDAPSKITPLLSISPQNNGGVRACNRQTDNLKTVIEKIELKIVWKRSYKWKTMPQVLSNAILAKGEFLLEIKIALVVISHNLISHQS